MNPGTFVGTLDVRLVTESHGDKLAFWRVMSPGFGFASSTGVLVTLDVGFESDFCSVPRIPGAFDYLGDIANQAGAVHDWLYSTGQLSRSDADLLLREMVIVLGYGEDKAELIYTGVRIFGAPHFTAAPTLPHEPQASATVIATAGAPVMAMAQQDQGAGS